MIMSNQDHIFLSCAAEPAQIAEWLASEFGMEVQPHDDWGPFVFRPAHADPTEKVGGLIRPNILASDDRDELLDGYPVMFEWTYTGRDEEVQLDEAKQIFTELAAKASRPMVLVKGFDWLIGAFAPETGPVWLPPGITPSATDKAVWEPFRAAS
jgi:hypothetical protein